MKILAILGSPRKNGNSDTLSQAFLDKAASRGADVSTYRLNSMEYKGCQGCGGCKGNSEACVLEDDISPLLEAMKEADITLLASPVYFGDVTGQLKLFIDRTFSLLTPEFMTGPVRSRTKPGSRMVFVVTQGQGEDGHLDVIERYTHVKDFFQLDGFDVLRGCELNDKKDATNRPALLAEAKALAERLVPNVE